MLFIIILALIRYMANVSTVNSDAIPAFLPESLYPDESLSGEVLVVPGRARDHVQQVSALLTTFYIYKSISKYVDILVTDEHLDGVE